MEDLIIGLYLYNVGILACNDIESAHIIVDLPQQAQTLISEGRFWVKD